MAFDETFLDISRHLAEIFVIDDFRTKNSIFKLRDDME